MDKSHEAARVPRTDMKSNLFKNILEWVIATGVLLSIIFFVQYFNRTKELRSLQFQVGQVQQNRQILNMLLLETAEYNKQRPDANLTRLLESVKAPAAGNSANSNPAPKSAQ